MPLERPLSYYRHYAHTFHQNTEGTEARDYRVRCSVCDRNLHSRMPLDPTPARLKRTYARVTNGLLLGSPLLLPVVIINHVETLKELELIEKVANHELCHHTDDVTQH
jgi:hypothetical protein